MTELLKWLATSDLTFGDIVLNLILALVFIFVVVMLFRFNRSNGEYRQFKVIDLIRTRRGKINRIAVMELGAWVVMTWAFVVQTLQGSLTAEYAGLYAVAFVIRGAHAAWLQSKQPNKDI